MPHSDAEAGAQTPARGVAQRGLLLLVRGYRLFFKAWVGNVCRYEPSCSSYMMQAVERHGALRGGALGTWRILRCNPWCQGGCDPVPDAHSQPGSGLFTRLLPEHPGQPLRDAGPKKERP
jgi:putative membrane protein insertion efficiency factor